MTASAEARLPRSVAVELDGLARAGLDLAGFLTAEAWDRHVGIDPPVSGRPAWSRTAIVIGGRGHAFARSVLASAPPSWPNPLDAASERMLGDSAARLAGTGIRAAVVVAHRPLRADGSRPVFPDFVALAGAAGLGWPSRLGLLLHPEAGPWIHLRGALLLGVEIGIETPELGAAPCVDCPAPCATACPGAAVAERFEVERCTRSRAAEPGCGAACAARRACVVGGDFAYAETIEAFHMRNANAHLVS